MQLEICGDLACKRITQRPAAVAQLALRTNIASSVRIKPGGLPCFERTSSQSPTERTTVTSVPLAIWFTTRAEPSGSS